MAQGDGVASSVWTGGDDGIQQGSISKHERTPGEAKRRPLDMVGTFFYASLIVWMLAIVFQTAIGGETNLWPVIVGFFVFEIFNRILTQLVESPSWFPGLKAADVDDFLNIGVSLLHSSMVSTLAVRKWKYVTQCLVSVIVLLVREALASKEPAGMWTHEVLTGQPWPGAFSVLGISCGYFAYDQWDMLRKRLYRPQSPSLLIHHAVLLVCFTAALFKNSCINYLVLTLICEVHSTSLHYRRVSIFVGASRLWTSTLALEWVLNWFTFSVTRVVVHVLITVKLLVDFKKFERGVELPLALMGMAGLNILNFQLGQGLYKAYLKERRGKTQKTS